MADTTAVSAGPEIFHVADVGAAPQARLGWRTAFNGLNERPQLTNSTPS